MSVNDAHLVSKARTLHDQLVGARDQRKAIIVVEGLADVLAEGVASATRRDAPSATIVWIRPQQVAQET